MSVRGGATGGAPFVVVSESVEKRAGAPAVSAEELFAHPARAATPAAEDSALITMDGAYLLGFGPRTAAAIRDLSAALYGPAVAN